MIKKPKESKSFKVLNQLFKHIGQKNRQKLFLLSFVILFSGVLELISLGSVVPVLQALNDPSQLSDNYSFEYILDVFQISPNEKILILIIFFMLASVFSGVFRIFNLWLNTRVAASIASEISSKVYSNSLRQPYLTQVSRNSSKIVIAITKYINSTIRTIVSFLQMYTAAFVAICLCSALLIASPKVTVFIVTSLLAAYYLISIFSRILLLRNSKSISNSAQSIVKITQESFASIREIIMTNSFHIYESNYSVLDHQQRNLQSINWFISGTPKYIIETLALLLLVGSGLFIFLSGLPTQEIVPLLGFFALAAQKLLPSMQQIYGSWSTIKGYNSDVLRIISLLEQENPHRTLIPPNPLHSLRFREIECRNISFCYPSTTKPILKNINIKIKAGQKIGIIGSTGSGKSTLVDILMGLILPTSGSLLVDGVDIALAENYNNLLLWRTRISQVPQEVNILENTVALNIAFGSQLEDINFERLYDSAKKANIGGFIDELPNQYEALLGENGVNLSGGQKQRIGLARAFYRQSALIILDEATSALDSETESTVIENVNSLSSDFTVIAIAHRLNTLSFCDTIIEVKDGTIVEREKSTTVNSQ